MFSRWEESASAGGAVRAVYGGKEGTVPDSNKPLVLVIEDDPTQRAFLQEVLDISGFASDLAGTCAEGRGLFGKGRYACALIDLGLPDGSGLEMIGEFAKADPCLVPVVLTGDASTDTVIDTMREGAFDYLTKPLNLTTLRATLARAMAHHSVVRERAELFRLLLEEREQLRARVEAATEDIRQYASACERSNARLRALLQLTQLSSNYFTTEQLLSGTFDEVARHVPLRCIIICDVTHQKVVGIYRTEDDEERFLGTDGQLALEDTASLLVESEPELLLRAWVERNAGLDTSGLVGEVFTQTHRNRVCYTTGFYLAPEFSSSAADQEFLDMCARFLAYEWEQSALLLQIAHHASLGSIGVELARNFIQPLTAIRTAADFVNEALISPEVAEGMVIIQDNVERLRRQTQEFRRLSILREDSIATVHLDEFIDQALDILSVAAQNRRVTFDKQFETDGECVLLNGATLARAFLDLMLSAVRVVDIGGHVSLRLRDTDRDHVAFEMAHVCSGAGRLRGAGPNMLSPFALDRDNPGLQLVERTVHSCGGTLSVEFDEEQQCTLRIVLPRNATSYGTERVRARQAP